MDTLTLHSQGLKKLPIDNRDFIVGSLLTLPQPVDLPDQYFVALPLEIKNQGLTDYCSGFASTAVSEDMMKVELDPLYQFMKSKQIEGDLTSFGCDNRSTAQSFVDFGSLPQSLSPYTIDTSRDTIINQANWSISLDTKASDYKRSSYMFVSEIGDYFDNIRLAIYKLGDSVFMGVDWCSEWLGVAGGIIESVGTPVSGHDIKIMGWKTINGQPYLMAQLSSGTNVGAGGLFFLSRSAVNAQKGYGAVIFTDYEKGILVQHQTLGLKVDTNSFTKYITAIINFFKSLKKW